MTDKNLTRAPFQVLVFLFRVVNDQPVYAIFKRSAANFWQPVSGGVNIGELPEQAAVRELAEETGINEFKRLMPLESHCTIPVVGITGDFSWGPEVLLATESCFAVEIDHEHIRLSSEHTEYRWLGYDEARQILFWDSNRCGLWELDVRLRRENDLAD